MARFYGTVQGSRGEVTRIGHKSMDTYCASWKGAIRCHAYIDDNGRDMVLVEKVRWQGQGENKVLYYGEIGEETPPPTTRTQNIRAELLTGVVVKNA